MRYIEKTLGADEVIVCLAHYHWLYFIWPMVKMVVVLTLGIGVRFITVNEGIASIVMPFMAVTSWLLIGFGVWQLFEAVIDYVSTERALTSSRLVTKLGLVRRVTEEISAQRMEEINLNQSIFGRMFGYGNVVVIGTGGSTIRLDMIDDPVVFVQHLNTVKNDILQER